MRQPMSRVRRTHVTRDPTAPNQTLAWTCDPSQNLSPCACTASTDTSTTQVQPHQHPAATGGVRPHCKVAEALTGTDWMMSCLTDAEAAHQVRGSAQMERERTASCLQGEHYELGPAPRQRAGSCCSLPAASSKRLYRRPPPRARCFLLPSERGG
jgi:hypothetical protein